MTNLTSAKLLAALELLLQSGVLNSAKPTNKHKLSKQIKKGPKAGEYTDQPDKKLAYEASVIKGFYAKGFKKDQVILRGEGVNGVQTYKGWLKLGRQVRKGQKGVKGCFHYSQTDAMETKADAAASMMAAIADHKAKAQPAEGVVA